MTSLCRLPIPVLLIVFACSGPTSNAPARGGGSEASGDPYAEYSDLEVGADYQSYEKINTVAFMSPTHGKRFVNVYVNDVGAVAYKNGDPIPVGTIVVKDSFENEGGQASGVAGPIFVMEKREAGFDAENGDWWYALHWAEIPQNWQKRLKAERAYWRTPSPKVGYCSGCHNSYDRQLGMVPDEYLSGGPEASDGLDESSDGDEADTSEDSPGEPGPQGMP